VNIPALPERFVLRCIRHRNIGGSAGGNCGPEFIGDPQNQFWIVEPEPCTIETTENGI
jgi:hypothetical protein